MDTTTTESASQYFTAVYRLRPGESATDFTSDPRFIAGMWGHAMNERDAARASGSAAPTPTPEHVAEVGPGWTLVWAGSEPIAHLLARHPGVRIGSKLYAALGSPAVGDAAGADPGSVNEGSASIERPAAAGEGSAS